MHFGHFEIKSASLLFFIENWRNLRVSKLILLYYSQFVNLRTKSVPHLHSLVIKIFKKILTYGSYAWF